MIRSIASIVSARQSQRVPSLLCQSFHPMPPPVLRWCQRVHSTMSSSLVLPSPHPRWLGHHKSHDCGSRVSCNEAAAFEVLRALFLQGRLRSSLHWPGYPKSPRRL
jgi:hypothetical protein